MTRLLLKVLGAVAFVAGAVTAPLPIPVGLPLMALGLSLLIMTSRTAVRMVRAVRARLPWFDAKMTAHQGRLPGRLGRALKRTNGDLHHALKARIRRRRDAL